MPMAENDAVEADHDRAWLVVAATAALGTFALICILRYRDPKRRMDRILRRCQERIEDIETSLGLTD
jgi:hypothetical protein